MEDLGAGEAHSLAGLGFHPAASAFQPLFHFLLSSLPDSSGWPVLLWETGKIVTIYSGLICKFTALVLELSQ